MICALLVKKEEEKEKKRRTKSVGKVIQDLKPGDVANVVPTLSDNCKKNRPRVLTLERLAY
jgi:hypothetical protein